MAVSLYPNPLPLVLVWDPRRERRLKPPHMIMVKTIVMVKAVIMVNLALMSRRIGRMYGEYH